jgi:hypothetical protein
MKEIFYSNGVDIFGPVTTEEFCKNRYYKSTLIWYEGLNGWVNIGDCEDLRHLVGTMSTPALDSGTPHSLPNLTPPLTKKTKVKGGNRKYVIMALLLFLILMALIAYYFNSRIDKTENVVPPVVADTVVIVDTAILDSSLMREKAAIEKTRLETEMKTYRMNWEKFITAVPNDYKQKEIGGIDDLKVIVRNNSPYKIDNLVVKVSYVKANGDNYQTEMMEFDNIDANGSKELFAPKSDRGVKVSCSIMSVKSTAMNLCLDKRDKNFAKKKGEDPFMCN